MEKVKIPKLKYKVIPAKIVRNINQNKKNNITIKNFKV